MAWPACYVLVVCLCLVVYELKLWKKMPDLGVYHRAGARFLRAEALYVEGDGHFQFKYPPVAALFFAPLGGLPIGVAKATWLCLSALALVASLRLSFGLLGPRRIPAWRLAALTLLIEAKFFGHELTLGQVNGVLLLGMLLMTRALARGQDLRAGAWLALVAAVKPYALIFVPYLGVRGRLKAVAMAVAGMGALLVTPVCRYGWAGNLELLDRWRATLARSTPPLLTSNDNVSLAGFCAKWGVTDSGRVLGLLVLGVAALLLALVLWTGRRPSAHPAHSLGLEIGALLILMPLVSPLGWDYVFLWSTPGVLLLLGGWRSTPKVARAVMVLSLTLIGGSLYDVLGRSLYQAFMAWSLLTPCFVVLVVCLAWRRAAEAS
jgi:alpha-1,2-mannosyltransferase